MGDRNKKTFLVLLFLILMVAALIYWPKVRTFLRQDIKRETSIIIINPPAIETKRSLCYRYPANLRKRIIEKGARLINEGSDLIEEGEHLVKRANMYDAGKERTMLETSHGEYQTEFAKKLREQGEEYKKKGEVLIKEGHALINRAQEKVEKTEAGGLEDETAR